MHSSSADWVRGVARLISSASTTCEKIGPGAELELLRALVEERDAGDVARQQVGRELDAAKRAVERARERLGEHGLADARHVLEQHVAFAQQRDQQQVDDVALADDDALDVRCRALGHAPQRSSTSRVT